MWDLVSAIVTGLVNAIPSKAKPDAGRESPPFVGGLVIASVILVLAAGFGLTAFIPDSWWAKSLIIFLSLLLALVAFVVIHAAVVDRRKQSSAPGKGFPVIERAKGDSERSR